MKAARRPWPTAVVIIVGPVTTSPAAKTCGTAVCSVPGSALSVRLPLVSRPNASVSAPMPAATMTTSHSRLLRWLSSYSGWKRPSGSNTQVQTLSSAPCTRPSPVKWSMPQPSCSVMPSARASSTSKSWAGISSQHSRLTWSTDAAPRRRAVRAASMATLPPPTTSTRLPARSTASPSLTAREEVERALDAVQVLAGHAQAHGLVRARRHEDGVEAVVLERGDVVDARVGRDLDADRRDVGDVVVDRRRSGRRYAGMPRRSMPPGWAPPRRS